MVKELDKPHGRPGRHATHHNHLHTAQEALPHAFPPVPPLNGTRPHVSEQEQRERHDDNTVPQPLRHALGRRRDEEVRRQRDEPAEEVPRGDGKRRDGRAARRGRIGLGIGGRVGAVLGAEEEVDARFGRSGGEVVR